MTDALKRAAQRWAGRSTWTFIRRIVVVYFCVAFAELAIANWLAVNAIEWVSQYYTVRPHDELLVRAIAMVGVVASPFIWSWFRDPESGTAP